MVLRDGGGGGLMVLVVVVPQVNVTPQMDVTSLLSPYMCVTIYVDFCGSHGILTKQVTVTIHECLPRHHWWQCMHYITVSNSVEK